MTEAFTSHENAQRNAPKTAVPAGKFVPSATALAYAVDLAPPCWCLDCVIPIPAWSPVVLW